MAGRLQIIAMATAMVSVLGSTAHAQASERVAAAGTTTTANGWRASLFVTRPEAKDDQLRLRGSTTVGARFSRPVARDTRVSLDVFNVFDKEVVGYDPVAATHSLASPTIADSYLFHPAEQRGVRLGIRYTFR